MKRGFENSTARKFEIFVVILAIRNYLWLYREIYFNRFTLFKLSIFQRWYGEREFTENVAILRIDDVYNTKTVEKKKKKKKRKKRRHVKTQSNQTLYFIMSLRGASFHFHQSIFSFPRADKGKRAGVGYRPQAPGFKRKIRARNVRARLQWPRWIMDRRNISSGMSCRLNS